jgi:hypothetical protein
VGLGGEREVETGERERGERESPGARARCGLFLRETFFPREGFSKWIFS